ncbi:hypothetical protein B0E52_02485 [Rhodanobacter sp. C06]|nr:hypothetical protein B0E52_02485 [Rhodanobacter sp. C06]
MVGMVWKVFGDRVNFHGQQLVDPVRFGSRTRSDDRDTLGRISLRMGLDTFPQPFFVTVTQQPQPTKVL